MKVTIICWELKEIFICHFHQRRPLLDLLPNQASVLYKKLLCPIWVRKALSTASEKMTLTMVDRKGTLWSVMM